ncbi:hypothetical protein [Streptomyces sp900105755]|uniref:Uncharacterized protein n=1 Tax=Streptomyces sp. 900105755 TaxID=3154389 RepID=A0ABV1TAN2_9ACTN
MPTSTAGARTWLTEADCDLDAFRALVDQRTDPADIPSAERVEQNVPLYDSDRLRALTAIPEGGREVQGELVRALLDGPGIVVLKGAFADAGVVDRATEAFTALIEEERASGTARGDHFAKPGTNDRVSEDWLHRVVAATAEGYPFPTNLDLDAPVDGLAPPSQADTLWQAVTEGWTPRRLREELQAGAERRQS